jgi:SAM-dependent methyltransferase
MTLNRYCPVCDEQRAKVLFRPAASPGPVSRCRNCGMVYIACIEDDHSSILDGAITYDQENSKLITSSNLDDIKDLWEYQFLPAKEAEWPALRQNANDALQRIELHVNRPVTEGKILDFGSGWGFFLAAARERSWLTYGLEPLAACSIYSRAKFGLNVITDTLREATFPSDFFDAITSFQVFEHLPYPNQDIQVLHKSLRKDGIILIEVPNFETWTMRLLKSGHRHFVQDHLNFFSRETLSQFLANHGFQVVDSYYPKRWMSSRHLLGFWFSKYLPAFVANNLRNRSRDSILRDITFGINLGDIVAVIAKKI